MLRFSAISLSLLVFLPAQSATDTELDRRVQEHIQCLATANVHRRLEAIAALEALDIDEENAKRLRIAAALASGLRGPNDVELAAARALMRCKDRSGASKELAQRTAQLRTGFLTLPEPKWPALKFPKFSDDPSPLLPELEPNPSKRKRLEREWKQFEKKANQAAAEIRRSEAQFEKDQMAAVEAQRKRGAAAERLAAFVKTCANHHDDALVDEWLRALDGCWRHAPEHASPIAQALCATRRRDAVERCIPFLTDPKMLMDPFLNRPLARIPGAMMNGRKAESDSNPSTSFPGRVLAVRSVVHEEILRLGEALGQPAPPVVLVPPGGDSQDATRAAARPPEWSAWQASVLPKLPLRLGDSKQKD
jgi:hypothetical protein